MMLYVVFLRIVDQDGKLVHFINNRGDNYFSILNAAEYGTPIGKSAKIANTLLALTPLNARLCVISWMARNRL